MAIEDKPQDIRKMRKGRREIFHVDLEKVVVLLVSVEIVEEGVSNESCCSVMEK